MQDAFSDAMFDLKNEGFRDFLRTAIDAQGGIGGCPDEFRPPVHMDFVRVKVTSQGSIDEEHHGSHMRLAMLSLERDTVTRRGTVVDASIEFDKRRLFAKHQPKMPPSFREKILKAVFRKGLRYTHITTPTSFCLD